MDVAGNKNSQYIRQLSQAAEWWNLFLKGLFLGVGRCLDVEKKAN